VTTTFTHKGWLGCCPCYFARLDAETPVVVARHEWLEWLLGLNTVIVQLAGTLMADPVFGLRVTGELNPPLELK